LAGRTIIREMLRTFSLGLAVLLGCLASAMTVRTSDTKLFLNEVLVAEFRAASEGLRPDQRAQQAAAQLRRVASDAKPSVKARGENRQILMGTRVLWTWTQLDARAAETSLSDLAKQTVDRLERARTLAPVAKTLDTVVLPVGRAVSLGLIGSQVRVAALQAPPDSGIRFSLGEAGPQATASKVGQYPIQIRWGSTELSMTLTVLPYAAQIPATLAVDVAGAPASAQSVRVAVTRAIELGVVREPGAQLSYSLGSLSPVERGQVRTVPVTVRATAPNAFEQSATMSIRVRNLGSLFQPEQELWYCNDPENVTQFQSLFMANLRAERPARILYHHLNAMRQPMTILVGVANRSDKPAQIFQILGDGEPHLNPVLVGYQAADRFWTEYENQSGVVLTIPPQSWVPIVARPLASGATMSGLGYLRLLPGGPEQLDVKAFSAYTLSLSPQIRTASTTGQPWAYVPPLSPESIFRGFQPDPVHIYPNPFRTEEVKFEVGGRFTFIRIGERAIPSQVPDRFLSGNFGVHYTVRVDLKNPLLTPAQVEVVFVASAGYSGGLFLVNGQYIRTKLLQPQGEERICRIRLEPGESRSVTIQTIPLSGSSYPATLAVRPIDTMGGPGR